MKYNILPFRLQGLTFYRSVFQTNEKLEVGIFANLFDGFTIDKFNSSLITNAPNAIRPVIAGEPFVEPLNWFLYSVPTTFQGIIAAFFTQRLLGSRYPPKGRPNSGNFGVKESSLYIFIHSQVQRFLNIFSIPLADSNGLV